ncbi:MAG TPA: hypothetical protein VGK58_11285 [Lacipirellulaceae bacterium]
MSLFPSCRYAERVTFQSPASRSARWVTYGVRHALRRRRYIPKPTGKPERRFAAQAPPWVGDQ